MALGGTFGNATVLAVNSATSASNWPIAHGFASLMSDSSRGSERRLNNRINGGSVTRGSGMKALEAALAGRRAGVVLSDMAPNMSGIAVSDQARSMELAELARDFALLQLQPEGVFLVKIFQGAGYDEYLKSLRAAFRKVVIRKPDASRDESAEQFLLARGLKA